MNFILPLLIAVASVGTSPDTPYPDARYPDTTELFRCSFDGSWDSNFDGWPNRWTRRRGRGFPHYVSISIDADATAVGGNCLRVNLDGGGAVAYSPAVEVSPLFAYVLEVLVKTDGLEHDRAYLSLTFLDRNNQRLETFCSSKVRFTDGWKKLRLGPATPKSDDVRLAVIGLHVEPRLREDLTGSVAFADVWLGRLLRTSLGTPSQGNLFFSPDDVQITCNASGFANGQLDVTFQLEDALGNLLLESIRPFQVKSISSDAALSLDALADYPTGFAGKAVWKPVIPGPGFYRARAMIAGSDEFVHRHELTLVVVQPSHSEPSGEFGWTLPGGDKPLPLRTLARLLGQAGINWVKYPLWLDESDGGPTVEQLVAFSERLTSRDIEMVGLLCVPPRGLREKFADANSLLAADIFRPGPNVWYPSLEPVMTRFATLIRWWQLGHDTDISFVDYPKLGEKISQIKTKLDPLAQDINLVIGWDWMNQLPSSSGSATPSESSGLAIPPGAIAWRGLSLSATPSMTPRELATYLEATSGCGLRRWVVVEPLSKAHYSLEVRAADLVRRMIAAKLHGADAIFCPQPFGDQQGLMNNDGTPGELFMPWRTTALALGGAKYLGSIELPGGSPNMVFARYDEAVMVVWNGKPRDEVIYLGDNVQQSDIWGNTVKPENREHRQVIRVDQLPTFIGPIDLPVAMWRMNLQLATRRIPSIAGREHDNSLTLKNYFGSGTNGQAELILPEDWTVNPGQFSFRLADDEQMLQPFEITIPYGTDSGQHSVRIDFQLGVAGKHKFSVYRRMNVGMGEVTIEIDTRLNKQGELEVWQRFINKAPSPVNFRCELFAPGQRRLRSQIIDLDAGDDVKVYRIEGGEGLLGKTLWISAKEIGGPRTLNYRFIAQR